MKQKKKRAFTLAELLIVVVLIATLSAIAIPQYKRVLEARKIGEAEAVLSAVRTEQERRCAIGQKYATNIAELGDLVPNAQTKNFHYSVDGETLKAQSQGELKYTLQLASFRDGRFCCVNASGSTDCNKFSYPMCSAFAGTIVSAATECAAADSNPDASTSAEGEGSSCTPKEEPVEGSCAANGGVYNQGGNKAKRTKITKVDCSVEYTPWDVSECFANRSGPCPCSEFGNGFDQGGPATCLYEEYGNGDTRNWTLSSNAACFKADQTESCSCATYGGQYSLGNNAAQCIFDLYGDNTKKNYRAGNISQCYKESAPICSYSEVGDRGCSYSVQGENYNWNCFIPTEQSGTSQYFLGSQQEGSCVKAGAMGCSEAPNCVMNGTPEQGGASNLCQCLYVDSIMPIVNLGATGTFSCEESDTTSRYTRWGFLSYQEGGVAGYAGGCRVYECKCHKDKIYAQ